MQQLTASQLVLTVIEEAREDHDSIIGLAQHLAKGTVVDCPLSIIQAQLSERTHGRPRSRSDRDGRLEATFSYLLYMGVNLAVVERTPILASRLEVVRLMCLNSLLLADPAEGPSASALEGGGELYELALETSAEVEGLSIGIMRLGWRYFGTTDVLFEAESRALERLSDQAPVLVAMASRLTGVPLEELLAQQNEREQEAGALLGDELVAVARATAFAERGSSRLAFSTVASLLKKEA